MGLKHPQRHENMMVFPKKEIADLEKKRLKFLSMGSCFTDTF